MLQNRYGLECRNIGCVSVLQRGKRVVSGLSHLSFGSRPGFMAYEVLPEIVRRAGALYAGIVAGFIPSSPPSTGASSAHAGASFEQD